MGLHTIYDFDNRTKSIRIHNKINFFFSPDFIFSAIFLFCFAFDIPDLKKQKKRRNNAQRFGLSNSSNCVTNLLAYNFICHLMRNIFNFGVMINDIYWIKKEKEKEKENEKKSRVLCVFSF